jgi:hypothetical protein
MTRTFLQGRLVIAGVLARVLPAPSTPGLPFLRTPQYE